MPCETGSTCDLTLLSCCLNADLSKSLESVNFKFPFSVTTVVPSNVVTDASGSTVTVATTIRSGSTVTSRTSSGTGCVDRVNSATGTSDCANRRALCNDANYFDVMTQQCPKTCGRCSSFSSTPTTGTCTDLKNPKTGTSDCASLRSFCNDSNYIDLMRTQCPRTCGFCGSSGSSSTTRSSATVSSGSKWEKL